jgi:hypothetical protein
MGHHDQIPGSGPLTNALPHYGGLLRLTAPVIEERIERQPGLASAKRQASGFQTAAPPTREHLPDRHPTRLHRRPNAPGLLTACGGQVALRPTIIEAEPWGIAYAWLSRGMAHDDNLPPTLE